MKEQQLKIVRFVNFTDEDFIGKWNSVPQLIPAGTSVPMEDWRAKHYAKHLINREVQKLPNGVKYTSPRRPEEIEVWREMLNKCIIDSEVLVPASTATMEIAKAQSLQSSQPLLSTVNCDECDFKAKNNVGLSAHKRSRHNVNG